MALFCDIIRNEIGNELKKLETVNERSYVWQRKEGIPLRMY